ncbi:cupin domain-containing protein [Actinomadura harenae]|uniref:Cupin domain-containing protein n=1 Tax=Actinomadura harenae TaxID=2483351 RepID=A0A3M2M4U1_9ACTN|nr:cupin domain-containing protein [Actinomadura harenae]RMI44050.1 cupin domain-containing protein [Actinomadura harenae]
MGVTAIDLFESFLRLRPDGQVHAEQPAFHPERADWQVMAFHVATDADLHADHWEIHPNADEVVACLTGRIRLFLKPQEGEQDEEAELPAGKAVIVPRGRWHRIELVDPGDILSVTLPRGSRLEERTHA